MIYFIRDRISRAIKIGVTNDPQKRLVTLQIGNPNLLTLMGTIRGALKEEEALHEKFKAHHVRGEWFQDDPQLLSEVLDLIERGKQPIPTEEPLEVPVPDDVVLPLDQHWEDTGDLVEMGAALWHPRYGYGRVTSRCGNDAEYVVHVHFAIVRELKGLYATKSNLWLVDERLRAAPANQSPLKQLLADAKPFILPDWTKLSNAELMKQLNNQ